MFFAILGALYIRHGLRHMQNPWADGPEMVTQCPIMPGGSYTYRFSIQDQEGTLWWHAHSRWLRATVYGALVIRPKLGATYPFPKPKLELPIVLGTNTYMECCILCVPYRLDKSCSILNFLESLIFS